MQTIPVPGWTIDVPDYGAHLDLDRLKEIVTRSGSHFFDAATMKYFRSRCDYHVYPAPDGWYFVTSEQQTAFSGHTYPRLYTVRCLRLSDYDGTAGIRLYELNGFQAYRTLETAKRAARRAAEQPGTICPACRSHVLVDPATVCTECQERAVRQAQKAEV